MSSKPLPAVLIVDDEPSLHAALQELLGGEYDLRSAHDAESAIECLRRERFACLLLDLTLPRMDGLAFLQRLRERDARTPVIVLTATKTVHTAVRAMRLGAEDYLTKPWEPDELRLAVTRAVERARLRDRAEAFEAAGIRPVRLEDIVCRSEGMRRVLDLARQMSGNDSRVLITGETGTGKELVARAIHDNGLRKGRPFIAVNCASIPAELAESEFFGHEKGAFTGAHRAKRGWFELADEGTLFLDEVTCLSPDLQAKLLRVLQDGLVHRVGSDAPVRVDVRVLAATNRDIRAETSQGRFREDLFYRLNVVPIHIPSLRERREDVPALLDHFLGFFNGRFHKSLTGYAEETRRLLCAYPWPGNVRELEHTVERLVILQQGAEVSVCHLPMDIVLGGRGAPPDEGSCDGASLKEARRRFEQECVLDALRRAGWNQSQAARLLKVSRYTLITKMERYGIRPPGPSGPDAP